MKKHRRRTPEEHLARQLRRQAKQIDQKKAKQAALRRRIAERTLNLCAFLIPLLSFLIPADRFCSGLISLTLLLAEAASLTIFHLFNSLWIKHRTSFLVGQFCAAAFILFMNHVERVILSSVPVAAALCIFSPMAGGWIALAMRPRADRAPFLALACALLLLPIALFSAQSANVSLDQQPPTEIQAAVLDSDEMGTGRGHKRYEIKLGLPEEDGSILTHWFTVQKTSHYEALSAQQEVAVLRHEGAFGAP